MTTPRKDWLAHTPARIVLASIALVALLVAAGSVALSTSVDFQRIALEHGQVATEKLDATGFPHATSKSVETYQFIASTPNGIEQATFLVDWQNHTVTSIDASERDADLVAYFPPSTYDRVKARFDALQAGQDPLDDIGESWGVFKSVVIDSDVYIEHEQGLRAMLWKLQLTTWAGNALMSAQNGDLDLTTT